MSKVPRLDQSVWKLMSEHQQDKYRKYGRLPKQMREWERRLGMQLSSRPPDRPKTGSKGTNPIDGLWDNALFKELMG